VGYGRQVDPSDGFGSELTAAALDGEAFAVRSSRRGDVAWVAMAGELDAFFAKALRAELDRVEADEPRLMVMDLRGLTFLDSSGLVVILGAIERARELDRGLRLVIEGSRAVETLFKTIGAAEHLDLIEAPAELARTLDRA
jgi:anti-sigma B factor antagonist